MPGLVEADDDGLYVLKFRGAGQGPKALVAELVAGELARAAGLPVPEIVFVELDPRARPRRARPGDPGADRGQRRAQRRARLPARLAHLQPRGRPAARPGARRRDRLARRADDERRPLAAEPEPAALARPAVADRPRRGALPAARVGGPAGRGASARSPRSATTCCCRARASIAAADERLAPRLDVDVVAACSRACPDDWFAPHDRAPSTPSTCAAGWRAARLRRRGRGGAPCRLARSSTRSCASCRRSSAASA